MAVPGNTRIGAEKKKANIFVRPEGGELKMLINIKGKTEVLQDLEKAKKLIDEAEKILYRMPTKIKFEVSGTEKESDTIQPDSDNQ